MSHSHPHHHPPQSPYSLVRVSAAERLAYAAAGAVVVWLVVSWALGWI